MQDVDQEADYNAYDEGNNQGYSDSYNGPVGDFPEPVRIESASLLKSIGSQNLIIFILPVSSIRPKATEYAIVVVQR